MTALMLLEKSRLHALAARLDDEQLRAAARFAVMAVVVLPLLPQGPYGPAPGIRPRQLWIWVLFFSGLSFAGYLARRAAGPRAGYPLAGLLGGMISSTSVTFSFARTSRRAHAARHALASGVIAACTMLYVRVAVATAVLRADLALALWPYLVGPFLVGAAALAARTRHLGDDHDAVDMPRNPLHVLDALQMAAVFQLVLYVIEIARRWAGEVGLVASGAVLGLTDLDALTLSMTRDGATIGVPLAARTLAAGLVANTALKLGVALVFGEREFRRAVALALAAMIAAILAGWLVA
jgi:uncharacterized membrane protein (DUF4010 family)